MMEVFKAVVDIALLIIYFVALFSAVRSKGVAETNALLWAILLLMNIGL